MLAKRRRLGAISEFLIMAGLAGCSSGGQEPVDAGVSDARIVISRVTVRPKEIATAFRNPGMGWLVYSFAPLACGTMPSACAYAETPLASATYTNNLAWSDLEPTRGVYRWELLDPLVTYTASKGRRLKLAVVTTAPTSVHSSAAGTASPACKLVPDWATGGSPDFMSMYGRWYDKAYGVPVDVCTHKYEPLYWLPDYQARVQELLQALAARWASRAPTDWKATLESLEISTYGYWGEWHSEIAWPASQQQPTLTTLVDQYLRAFPDGPELTMNVIGATVNPAYDLGKGDPNAVAYAVDKGAHLVRKNIGGPGITAGGGDELTFISKYLATRRLQGEWYYVLTDPRADLDAAINDALDRGASYLGWYDPVLATRFSSRSPSQTLEEYFQTHAGYRLVLAEASYNTRVVPHSALRIDQRWFQRGVAKLYQPYRQRAYLVAGGQRWPMEATTSFDADRWPAGPGGPYAVSATYTVPNALVGRFELHLALVDERGEPAINLAIEGKDTADPNAYGTYRLGLIEVLPAHEPPS
jgi:hypothetical protein